MTDWKLFGLMIYTVAAVVIGTILLCLSTEFIGDGYEIQDVTVDWSKAVVGLALLVSAGLIAVWLAQ